MNIQEIIRNNGKTTIPNPEYNPKAKKNKQPEFITVTDYYPTRDGIVSLGVQDAQNRKSVESSVAKKYESYGLPYDFNADMDTQLANAQSNWSKLFNGLSQTLVSEIGLGTIKAATDMIGGAIQAPAIILDNMLSSVFDMKNDPIQSMFGMQEGDYSNPISNKLEEWQEKFNNEVAPVYATPGVDITSGGLTDFGWWMSNMPSIMSSLTLLIPTKLATVGAAKLGPAINKANKARKVEKVMQNAKKFETLSEAGEVSQASKTTKELNAWQKLWYNPTERAKLQQAGKIGSEALLMRTIENYQEAHQSYNDMYQKSLDYLNDLSDDDYNDLIQRKKAELGDDIDYTNKDEVAKRIAKKAADRTFLLDYSNTIFDVIQLYALRDVGKLAKNVKSGSVKAAHKASIARAGKKSAEIAEKEATSTAKSIGNKIWDYTTGSAKLALSEASEGVEEAVNYIAQQEGITYGNTLLENETDSTLNGFWNKRLANYLGNAELLESAFWGVAGGVVFGAAGSAFNKAKIRKQNKRDAERRAKQDETTKEKVQMPKSENDFISMSDMPEVKAAKEAIHRRNVRLEQLQNDLQAVKDGKNPFLEGQPDLEGDIESQQERLRADLIQRYRSEMALDAINSGTFDMLVDYFRSENVKQALIDSNATSKEEADRFINETVRDLEDVRQAYNTELSNVNYQITALNASRREGSTIPLEYVQQIARANVDKRLRIKNLERQLGRMEAMASRVQVDDMTAGDLEHAKHTIRLAQLIDAYSRLEADKEEVKADTKLTEWRRAESIEDLNHQQQGLFTAIKDLYASSNIESADSRALGAILQTIRISKSYYKVGTEYFEDKEREGYKKTDEEIIKEYSNVFGNTNVSTTTLSQISKTVEADMNAVLGEGGLYDKNNNLFNIYTNIADIETSIGIYKRMIDSSQYQISKEVDRLHNTRDKVRFEVITKAEKVIRDIHTKYLGTNQEAVERAVIKAFFEDRNEAARIAREQLTGVDENGKSDAEKLMDALNIINFSQGANREIFNYIAIMLHENSERFKKRNQNSTTSQNPISASQPPLINNNTQQPQNIDTTQATNENGQVTTQNTNEELTVNINDDGEVTRISRDNRSPNNPTVTSILHEDGDIELDIANLEDEQQKNNYVHSELFKPITVDELNEGIELRVQKNPILEETDNGIYKVKEQGIVIGINRQTGEIINFDEVEESEPDNAVISSTGGVTPSSIPSNEGVQPTGTIDNTSTTDTSITDIVSEEEQAAMDIIRSETRTNFIRTALGELFIPTNEVSNTEEVIRQHASEAIAKAVENIRNGLIPTSSFGDASPEDIKNRLNSIWFNMPDEELRALVEKEINNTVNAVLRLKAMQTGLDRAAAGFALAARYEEPTAVEFSNMFIVAAEAFMKEYAKTNLVPQIDGKYVVNLRDILRICNDAANSAGNTVAREMFEVVKNYLTSDIGAAKYQVLDIEDMATGEVLNKVNKTTEELQQENDDFIPQRLNIYEYMNIAKTSNDEQYFRVLNSLNAGDKLTMRVQDKKLTFYKGDTIIGTMPTPRLYDDTYMQYNEAWRTDVKMGADGTIESEFKNLVVRMFTEDHPDFVKLRELLVRAKIAGQGNISQDIYNAFEDIPFIQDLINDSIFEFENGMDTTPILYVEGDKDSGYSVNTKRAFDHLTHLWNYVTGDINETNLEDKKRVIRRSLNTWCAKLYDTYDNIYNQQGDIDVEIAYFNEGQINRITNNTVEDYDKLLFVRGAIKDQHNIRLAIVDYNYDTHVSNPADGPSVISSGLSKGSTLVAVFSKNKKPDFVQAYGARVDDVSFRNNPMFDKILKGTAKALTDAFLMWENDNSLENFNKIVELIKGLFAIQHSTGDIIPLFRGKHKGTEIYINENIDRGGYGFRGMELVIKTADGRFHNFTLYNRGRDINGRPNPITAYKISGQKIVTTNTKDGSIARNAMLGLLNMLHEHCAINISFDGIKGDNVYSDVTRGFLKRTMVDGKSKVILDIQTTNPDLNVHEEYDSYNDFIISNDFIRVNTFTGEDGSLFTPKGSNQRKNQVLYVNMRNYRTPVKENASIPLLANSNADTYTRLVDIMNSNKKTPGLEIMQALEPQLHNELVGYANELGIDLNDIFPNDIYYRENLNRLTDDGTFDTNTPLAQAATEYAGNKYDYWRANGTVGSTRLRKGAVVVGPRLLNMFSGPRHKRLEGIRKLMHEQIHRLTDKDNKNRDTVLLAVGEVYEEFKQLLKEDLRNNPTDVGLNYVKNLFAKYDAAATRKENDARRKLAEAATEEERRDAERKIAHAKDVLYSEFMAEAMTNKVLYSYLNSKELKDVKREESKSLFAKLAELIAKLFNWTINDNSLYAKFLNALNSGVNVESELANVEESTLETGTIDNTETIDEEDSDRLDTLDEEDYLFDDDDSALSAVQEEIDADGFKRIPSIAAMRSKIHLENRRNFDNLINNSIIEYKCS